jgi:hypothetical protein
VPFTTDTQKQNSFLTSGKAKFSQSTDNLIKIYEKKIKLSFKLHLQEIF